MRWTVAMIGRSSSMVTKTTARRERPGIIPVTFGVESTVTLVSPICRIIRPTAAARACSRPEVDTIEANSMSLATARASERSTRARARATSGRVTTAPSGSGAGGWPLSALGAPSASIAYTAAVRRGVIGDSPGPGYRSACEMARVVATVPSQKRNIHLSSSALNAVISLRI